MSVRVAIIDVGTVTARLAIADVEGGRVLNLMKQSTIVNLGEGVDASGRLLPAAMDRAVACLSAYVETARRAGYDGMSCTLTSAARDAENAGELLSRLDGLGLRPEVIPGQVEGSLTFLGVAQDFPGAQILVADNGGGSTELALGQLGEGGLSLAYVRSLDVGCRRMTERYFADGGAATQAQLAEAGAFAETLFADAACEMREVAGEGGSPERLVVTGGTSTSMVAVEKSLVPYDPKQVHLATLSRAQVEGIEHMLAALPVGGRAEVAGLQPQRAPVMLGGVVAVDALMRATGFDVLTVSESDLLFGMAIQVAAVVEGAAAPLAWRPQVARPGAAA